MAIEAYSKKILRCLSTDEKPANDLLANEITETDTGKLFKWDGASWVEVGSSTFTQAAHDALPNPHHSNALDHTQNSDTDLDATFEAALKNTDNHTNGTTNKVYTATEQTKLAGIEASAVALATVKADSDIADAISKKHANTSDHAQNTDTDLDATFEATFMKKAQVNL